MKEFSMAHNFTEKRDLLDTVLLSVIALLTCTNPAMAYIDPVTGSVVVQALIGGIAAAMVTIRGVRERVLSLFRGRKPSNKLTDEERPKS